MVSSVLTKDRRRRSPLTNDVNEDAVPAAIIVSHGVFTQEQTTEQPALLESNKLLKWMVCISLLFGVCFVTVLSGILSAQEKVRQYFSMPAYIGIVPEHVQAATTEQVPRDSPRRTVAEFLSSRRIGEDGYSRCEDRASTQRITCQLGTAHHFWQIVRESYSISFAFDSAGKLQEVFVRHEFSAL
jgi:hypothetical protein